MKKINLKIRIDNATGKVAFLAENNYEENASAILEMLGALDLIKDAYLKKLGEIIKQSGDMNNGV